MMRVLWLVVGRGGSRGVPGKNLRRIEGRTLVDWKIAGALAGGAEGIVVSSDDPGIRAEARRCGAVREIVRPAELATDEATTASVVAHALGELRRMGVPEYDAVSLLECSSPFVEAGTYRAALKVMEERDADLVVSVKTVEPHVAFIGEEREDASVTGIVLQFQRMARRRQDFRSCVTMSGGIYLFRRDMFERTGDVYGGVRNFSVKHDRWHAIEIDTPEDLELAEFAASRGKVKYGA